MIMKINTQREVAVAVENRALQNLQRTSYLRNVINISGGTDEDIKSRVRKLQAVFYALRKSRKLKSQTKI